MTKDEQIKRNLNPHKAAIAAMWLWGEEYSKQGGGSTTPNTGCPLPSTGRMADGLYRVVTSYLCAGFVVEGGKVTNCAPILRKRLAYWQTVANLVAVQNTNAR
jgi:hypothetical protein